MKTVMLLLATIMLLGCATAAAAPLLDRSHVAGVGLQMSYPYEELGESQNTGWGLHALLDYPLFLIFNLTGDVGFNSFAGKDGNDGLTVWEFAVGAKVVFGRFFMGGDVAYYTQADQVSWVPSIGLRFTRWEAALRIKALGRDNWTGLRVGFYF